MVQTTYEKNDNSLKKEKLPVSQQAAYTSTNYYKS
jgi:hypothetical protein